MKQAFLIDRGPTLLKIAAAVATVLLASQASAQTTLLAGYDFQTTTNGGTATMGEPNSPNVYLANFGTQAGSAGLYLNGANGSSTFVTAASGNELTAYNGTTVNAGSGFSTTTTGAAALGVLGTTANSKSMVFVLSTTGYRNLVLTFATQRTSTGFTGNTFSYSTDGTNFTQFATGVAPATSYATITEDFSSVAALNNAATVYIEYTLAGATETTLGGTPVNSGNNRLDNIQFNASPVPEPGTAFGSLLLVGVLGWNQRRWLDKSVERLRNACAL